MEEVILTDKDIEDIKALMPNEHSPRSDRWVFWLVAQNLFPNSQILTEEQQQTVFAVLASIHEMNSASCR